MTDLPTHEGHGRRGKLKTADEWDTFSNYWRHMIAGYQRAGATKRIKRGFNRRQRRHTRQQLRQDHD